VIITAYDPDRYEDVVEAVESVLAGAYPHRNVIVVVDGPRSLHNRLKEFWDREDVTVLWNEENLGAAQSRNRAVEHSQADIVAFMDDDAVADEAWLAELIKCYVKDDALAAGGKMTPIWVEDKPEFLPEEFYWLIGVTYRGFPNKYTEVRNTFASNLSFDRETFDRLDGFNPNVGPTGESLLQSAETELCARLRRETGEGVLYNPDARVGHKVFAFRTDPVFLLRRAFWQGVSKRGMEKYAEADLGAESDFLSLLFTRSIPERFYSLLFGDRRRALSQLIFLLLGTVCVGGGYLWGWIRFAGAD
jgi:glycosyltransferase involved in cell wall biosynthesis